MYINATLAYKKEKNISGKLVDSTPEGAKYNMGVLPIIKSMEINPSVDQSNKFADRWNYIGTTSTAYGRCVSPLRWLCLWIERHFGGSHIWRRWQTPSK